jgi:hypothetical protein
MPVNCRNCVLPIAVAVEPTLDTAMSIIDRSRKFQQLLCPFYPLLRAGIDTVGQYFKLAWGANNDI